jgi:CO dehydrogenase maturation factor
MEAGIEHLGRGTVAAVDRLLVVVEPSRRSVETALRIRRMAGEIKLQALCAVGNKIRTEQERTLLQGALPDLEFAGFVPWDEALVRADLAGRSPLDASERVDRAVEQVADFLEEASAARSTKGTA